jgi:ATP-binding cassette subfamily B protein
MTLPGFVQNLVIGIGSLAVICTGSLLLTSGELSVRSFIVAVVFSAFFSDAIARLMTYTHKIMIYGQSRKNILNLLNLAPDVPPGYEELPAAGDIRFQELSFRYDSGRGVEGINLTIPEGSTTAVIGPSGSGKSTLAHLIAGLEKGYSGSLTIGESQVSRIKDDSLSAKVALVQQDVFLFNTSIRENLGLGDPGADDGQIEDAARRARIHDFIAGLPDGYQTLAGEKGVRFSGGEKQRISIARMLLKDAPVVVFDEATSAVDPGNEALIGEGVKALSRGRTVIVIAHNMDMVRTADQIVLMKEGRIDAVGSHKQLMEESPLYQEMVRSQQDADQWMIREGA